MAVAMINGHKLESGPNGFIVDSAGYYGAENPVTTMQGLVDALGSDSSKWDPASRAVWDARAQWLGFPQSGGVVVRPTDPFTIATPSVSDSEFVTALYQHYYNRVPDAAGLAFWVNEITSNRKTRAGVEQAFASSPDIVQAAQPGGGGGGSTGGGGTVINTGGGGSGAVVIPAASGMSPLLLIGLGIGAYFLLKD